MSIKVKKIPGAFGWNWSRGIGVIECIVITVGKKIKPYRMKRLKLIEHPQLRTRAGSAAIKERLIPRFIR